MSWKLHEEKALVALHQATSIYELSQALFTLVRSRLIHQNCFLMLRPLEFELSAICSHSRYRHMAEIYIRERYHRYDIWLKRSPAHPRVKAVRHSDYTPLWLLKRTLFYRYVLNPYGSLYGTSFMAWRGDLWLATLTIFRTATQGDFTDAELHLLHRWQLHFEVAIRRIASRNEDRMLGRALTAYVSDLPDALILIDWDMRVISHNQAAIRLCDLWRKGAQSRVSLLKRRLTRFELPASLQTLLQSLRPRIEKKKTNRPGSHHMIRFAQIYHRDIHGLRAQISFIPSKTLSLSRGLFLIRLHYNPTHSPQIELPAQLAELTRQEREVARRAALGQTNSEIAHALGKSVNTVKTQLSSVFRKLKMRSKIKLAATLRPMQESSL
jgi:DNA-binding CsgD family transcriptional regulator